MRDFAYEAPTSLADAVGLLAQSNGNARPLAGGTDLIDHVRTGRLSTDLIVDLKKIPELMVLELNDAGLRLGAAVPCYQIYGHQGIVENYSAITDSSHIIGGMQIQNRASVGGNLANAGAAADSTPALIALEATVVIAGPDGNREVAVEDFCTGPRSNVLEPGEICVSRPDRLTAARITAGSFPGMKWILPWWVWAHLSCWTKVAKTSFRPASGWGR